MCFQPPASSCLRGLPSLYSAGNHHSPSLLLTCPSCSHAPPSRKSFFTLLAWATVLLPPTGLFLPPFYHFLCLLRSFTSMAPWETDSLWGNCCLLDIKPRTIKGTLMISFPLQGTLLDTDGPQRTLNQNLELRFQYSEDSRQPWFVVYSKQVSSGDRV